ncbi:MAG: Na/Pi cotransporter family protein [Verrucomicrobiales bacterium]|nr:Na/Pi cotransporter family protein [Verrucomicrobiota bacterium JB025]
MFTLATISAVSIFTGLLHVLGALGVFLFGMKIMSEAVQRIAGKRMRQALSGMTNNRFSGVFTGFVTTSLVQSSSATTVLVVSFVNAGLLTLVQSIGVIMGANLGTTITAWIVAIVGKFSVSKIALPVIGIGLPFVFIGKDKGKSWGEMLLGFGLVFFGLGLLKDSVPDLKTLMLDDPGTAATIEGIVTWMGGRGFLSILLYLFGGIALTLMVQSSSAAMAITITCALNGWLGNVETDPIGVFQNSAAIVLGENIGTTVTAWLASLGANVHARRAARAHFSFNVLGVIWLLVAFYPFTQLCWYLAELLPDALREANSKMGSFDVAFATAIFHTMFNLCNIGIMVAFVPQIAKLVEWWVKEPDTKKPKTPIQLKYISQNLVDLGELNIAEAESASERMGQLTIDMFDGFVDVLKQPDVDLSEQVSDLKKMEDACDLMLQDITTYLIQCSTHEIGKSNANRIASMLRVVSEFEEATDRIYRLVKVVQRKYTKDRHFAPAQDDEILALCEVVRNILIAASTSLSRPDTNLLKSAENLEKNINALRKTNNKGATRRMQQGGQVPNEMLFIDINNHLEAVGNLALNVVQNATGAV